ncbi:MAG: hypothetical protein J7K31_03395 [Candidatus Aenigmarchaeota archaeon]|nr:hypothetical protein [Candidatus Aenigmarchaeota archaeon]
MSVPSLEEVKKMFESVGPSVFLIADLRRVRILGNKNFLTPGKKIIIYDPKTDEEIPLGDATGIEKQYERLLKKLNELGYSGNA